MKKTILIAILSLLILSCEEFLVPEGPEDYEDLDEPISDLNVEHMLRHAAGDEAFEKIYTIEEGLGPVFNSNSCNSCHPGEGKGHPSNSFIRFGQSEPGHGRDKNPYATFGDGGNQLQDRAIPGYEPERLPEGAPYSRFIAPIVTGLGYLDAVADETILEMADPDDKDGDGIRGRPSYNYLPEYLKARPNSIPKDNMYIYRFGKKALSYDLLQQTIFAANQDIGIVSTYAPVEPYDGQIGDPEISNQTIKDIEFYLKTLKAPERRNEDHPDVLKGEAIFSNIDCATCHRPTLTTGYSDIPQLNQVEFHPYTDLLLHDMGPDLDDGYTEGDAETYEWRTPPLWGIGNQKERSQGGKYYLLHDGRANSIEEAILYHGGEAENARKQYENLSQEEKSQLVKFIESL